MELQDVSGRQFSCVDEGCMEGGAISDPVILSLDRTVVE